MEPIEYSRFLRSFAWRQGQHVSIIGRTGSGKTTLELSISQKRGWKAFIVTKKRDDDLRDALKRQRYHFVRNYPFPAEQRAIALWPDVKTLYSGSAQREAIRRALDGIYKVGGWCVILDEVYYLANILKLEREMDMLWTQARSSKISILAGTQQPRFIPQNMLTMAHHLFFFGMEDDYVVERAASVAGVNRKELSKILLGLAPYYFYYRNLETRESAISKVE